MNGTEHEKFELEGEDLQTELANERAKAVQANHNMVANEQRLREGLDSLEIEEPSEPSLDHSEKIFEERQLNLDLPDIEKTIQTSPDLATAINHEQIEQARMTDIKEQNLNQELPDSHEERTAKLHDLRTDPALNNEMVMAEKEMAKDIEAQVKQELPKSIKNQYLVDEHESKFFDKSNRLAFEVVGDKRITTVHKDANTIDSMLTVAQSKGWKSINLTGDKDFKRETWVQASMKGIQVHGYSPSKEDKALLSARIQAQEKNIMSESKLNPKQQEMNAIVKTVAQTAVQQKVANPATQAKVLAAIDKRSVEAIEHGKAPAVAIYDKNAASRNQPVQIHQQENTKERSR